MRTVTVHVVPAAPDIQGDQVGAKAFQGVDIHGVPLPDPSPTGEGESDRIPNQAYVDAYSLTPSFSTTDVSVPMPGSELTMEFRRTEHVDSRVVNTQPTNGDTNYQWPSESVLGAGWSTNIASRVIVSDNPSPQNGHAPITATVYDDVGNAVSYFSYDGSTFSPDVRSNFSNLSLRAQLTVNGSGFVYREKFGTTLYYSPIERQLQRGGASGPTETYFRLEKIVDRNSNEIDYDYTGSPDPTLVSTIYDPSLGDASTSARKLTFAYMSLAGEWRLTSVTDPLGQEYDYTIDNSTGLLDSVVKPAVANPDDPDGPLARPHVDFTYYPYDSSAVFARQIAKTNGLDNPWEVKEVLTWTLPDTITDANGAATSFDYTFRWTPTESRKKISKRWDFRRSSRDSPA